MRVGQNPNRIASAKSYRPLIFAIVTHLPNFLGYHSQRMAVVQTCIRSMTANADREHTLIIWDNGSCRELKDWIRDAAKPDVFIESFNIGKTAARSSIARMIPPDHTVCYSDDDMYFTPGWLAPQLDLLEHFPNVAAVTGYPVRTAFRWGVDKTVKWAKKNAEVEYGRFIPEAWERDFCDSIGREWSLHKENSAGDKDVRITYNGVQAYATAHHCQFIAPSETLAKVAAWDGKAMGDEKVLDVALDKQGLRLATTERLTRHIGNVLDNKLMDEIAEAERVARTRR